MVTGGLAVPDLRFQAGAAPGYRSLPGDLDLQHHPGLIVARQVTGELILGQAR